MKETSKKQDSAKFKPVLMKKVLVALDYDPSAQKIAETGYSLAKSMNAELILLHIVSEMNYYTPLEFSPIMGYTGFNTADYPNLVDIEIVKEASAKFLEKSKQHLGDENIQIIVGEGETADVILSTALKTNADIIVVGTHSRSGFEKLLMGSVAEKVLHLSSKPVFIIPSKKKSK